ncbi:tetratricopeptide repeat protein [Lentibacillus sp. Marseille-P4043]|uniref:tetratricopeptide repeat protein n=1 Tax=Lentibacillus sp. Marseille-P4043 TaxID=2040293 RepID=UPI000D0B738D|nr:tetratricopeptide repeat protein [Lentibacillus sp. Marseille-P4043]
MANKDILNLEEQFEQTMNEANKDDLQELLEEFKRNHFPNVLSKSAQLRDKYQDNKQLVELLMLLEAVSHAQIEEFRRSSEIIQQLYNDADSMSGNELITLGELAFMSDYKLARRILSDAVKRMETEAEPDRIKLARGYLVLGEAEEQLEKFTRAIKYFKQGLTYFQADDIRDKYMILYLHFKIGMLYSTKNEQKEAIEYLQKAVELADENKEMKINSLVSLAKIYGSRNDNEMAYSYLKETLGLIDDSALSETLVHAEALIEMAFYYFDQSKLDEAVPYYQRAIDMYKKQPGKSDRKLGMVYMQYAYCLEHKDKEDKHLAGVNYERAIEQLEKIKDRELLENAFADVIAFFDATNNTKKKRIYENKFVKMVNA